MEWPKEGDKYWFISDIGDCYWDSWNSQYWHKYRRDKGNIYRTKEEAEEALENELKSLGLK